MARLGRVKGNEQPLRGARVSEWPGGGARGDSVGGRARSLPPPPFKPKAGMGVGSRAAFSASGGGAGVT